MSHGTEHENPDPLDGNDELSGTHKQLVLEKVEEVLDARDAEREAESESRIPIQVRRFKRWIGDAFHWAWYTVRKEPLAVAVVLGALALTSSAAVNYIVEREWLDPKDFPFVVQSQYDEAMCQIRVIRHDQCNLLVGIGQVEGPCPAIPSDCSIPPEPSE